MERSTKKVVQTELKQTEYEALTSAARSRNLTIKEAARQALLWWTLSIADVKEDPFFKLHPVEFKVKVRADRLDRFLYQVK